MQPAKSSKYLSSLHPSYLPTTSANPGDILFSSTVTNHRSNSLLSSSLHPSTSTRHHQNSFVCSLVDPNIELPTISANEVEQVFSQLQSSNSSSQPLSRKTTGYWLSKDDSFTPPPTKRSFGGCVAPARSYASDPMQSQHPLQMRASSLVAALQLPPLGSVNSTSSSSSPPPHAALRRQLLAPLNTLTNLSSAAKQRQENLTVRLANRAKLTAGARIPVVANGSSVDSECSTPTRSVVSQQAPMVTPSSNDLHIPQEPNERFRFVCPHPRCGRRYQARIGLTRHLLKYHEESVETAEDILPLKSSAPKAQQETLQPTMTAAINGEERTTARLSRSPVANANGFTPSPASSAVNTSANSSNLKLCLSFRTVRVDHRSSQSLDRSKVQRRCPSPPPPSSSISTLTCPGLHPSGSSTSGAASISACAALRGRTSPSLLSDRPGTASGIPTSSTAANGGGGATKVAIVSMQHSPAATTTSTTTNEHLDQLPSHPQPPPPPSQLQPRPPFNMSIYSNDVSELPSTSGGALTEPWCCNSSDRTAPVASLAPCSSSCCWPDDYEEFEHEEGEDEVECEEGDETDFLEGDCSSDLGFDSCYYPSRPTDSLPCLLHPTYPRHFHSPPPSFHHLLPRGSALDLSSTTGMTEECSSCCWTADSDFSSSLGYGRGGRHSSEDGRFPPGGFWTSPYLRVPPPRQRKQRLSSTSSALFVSRRRFSTAGGEKKSMRWRRDRHGRRRTVSSSGESSGGILIPPTASQHAPNGDSMSAARPASVICGGGCDHSSSSMTKVSDELVTCPVHDCGLVCSGCENLCEHLKECHLPDSQKKPVRLIFACPVKSCRTFCANEAAFEAHFDAHLENRITGKIGDYFRRTPIATTDDYMVNGASIARHPQQQSCRRHVKSTSSLVDLNIDALGDISLPPMSPTMGPHITASNNNQISGDPDFSARTSPAKFDSPSTPIGNLDGENWSLLQALDLLPDDDLHELLQGKTAGGSTSGMNGAFTGPPLFNGTGNTPTLSNGSSFGGIGGDACLRSDEGISNRSHHQQQQTPMLVSSSSDSEAFLPSCGAQASRRRSIGSSGVVKRQRNSLTCLDDFPKGDGLEEVVALSRARSTQLGSKKKTFPPPQPPLPPPNTLPSASQLLFQNKSMNSHAVSTEDLFHLPDWWQTQQQHPPCQRSDSAYTTTWQDEAGTTQFSLPAYHLSDTEMPPPPSLSTPHHLLPATANAAPPHPRRVANRLKRRRRAFGERFYTFDSRFLPPLSSASQQQQLQ